jgi:hypothetical protein
LIGEKLEVYQWGFGRITIVRYGKHLEAFKRYAGLTDAETY